MQITLAITETETARFNRDGFLLFDRIIDPESVEALRQHMAGLFEGVYKSGLVPDEVNWRPGDPAHLTRQICNGWKASPDLAALVLAPEIGQAAARLNGWPGARLAQDNVLWKPPATDRPGGALGMHRDSAYAGFSTHPLMCTVWIALDDVSAESGTMVFARGSHRWAKSPPAETFHDPDDYLAEFRAAGGREEDLVPVEVPTGGGSIHHGWLWHGSGPNRTKNPRRSLVSHCLSSDATFTETVNPVYSRYKPFGGTTMDEAHFPILWHRDRAPTSFIAPYVAGDLAWSGATAR